MSEEVAVSKHSTYFFLGSDLKNIISCEKNNRFLLVKLRFFLYFISDFIPLDPDPDQRTQMNPDPHHCLTLPYNLRDH